MTATAAGHHLGVDEGDADDLNTLALVQATSAATQGTLAVVEMRLPAGFSPPPHVHHAEDEAFYVVIVSIVHGGSPVTTTPCCTPRGSQRNEPRRAGIRSSPSRASI